MFCYYVRACVCTFVCTCVHVCVHAGVHAGVRACVYDNTKYSPFEEKQ